MSRKGAPALLEKLCRHPFERQLALIRDTGRFRTWGLCEFLCAESERIAPADPKRAEELALLAVEVVSFLEEWQPAEQIWLDQLRGYAWAHLGNARRVSGNLPAAEEAFSSAEALWRPANDNAGDVLGYEARYFALKASLRRAQRLLPEALVLLDQALSAEPDPSLRARILINKAKTCEEMGRIEEAIEILAGARSFAAIDGEPRIRLSSPTTT